MSEHKTYMNPFDVFRILDPFDTKDEKTLKQRPILGDTWDRIRVMIKAWHKTISRSALSLVIAFVYNFIYVVFVKILTKSVSRSSRLEGLTAAFSLLKADIKDLIKSTNQNFAERTARSMASHIRFNRNDFNDAAIHRSLTKGVLSIIAILTSICELILLSSIIWCSILALSYSQLMLMFMMASIKYKITQFFLDRVLELEVQTLTHELNRANINSVDELSKSLSDELKKERFEHEILKEQLQSEKFNMKIITILVDFTILCALAIPTLSFNMPLHLAGIVLELIKLCNNIITDYQELKIYTDSMGHIDYRETPLEPIQELQLHRDQKSKNNPPIQFQNLPQLSIVNAMITGNGTGKSTLAEQLIAKAQAYDKTTHLLTGSGSSQCNSSGNNARGKLEELLNSEYDLQTALIVLDEMDCHFDNTSLIWYTDEYLPALITSMGESSQLIIISHRIRAWETIANLASKLHDPVIKINFIDPANHRPNDHLQPLVTSDRGLRVPGRA